MLPVSIAQLGALLTQAILYGVYLVTIGFVFQSFSSRSARFRRIVDTVLCGITFIIALSVTLDFALNIQRMVDVLNSVANISTTGECDVDRALTSLAVQQPFPISALRVSTPRFLFGFARSQNRTD